jgi:hypothetical protein
MAELIYKLIFCHLIGDYVLQIDFIAKTKGENMYHLLVHCFLYAVPFYVAFGYDARIPIIITTHIKLLKIISPYFIIVKNFILC